MLPGATDASLGLELTKAKLLEMGSKSAPDTLPESILMAFTLHMNFDHFLITFLERS